MPGAVRKGRAGVSRGGSTTGDVLQSRGGGSKERSGGSTTIQARAAKRGARFVGGVPTRDNLHTRSGRHRGGRGGGGALVAVGGDSRELGGDVQPRRDGDERDRMRHGPDCGIALVARGNSAQPLPQAAVAVQGASGRASSARRQAKEGAVKSGHVPRGEAAAARGGAAEGAHGRANRHMPCGGRHVRGSNTVLVAQPAVDAAGACTPGRRRVRRRNRACGLTTRPQGAHV
ncbi:unnamed protein product [Chondrus crispus]|uniref:Uncharacterized protein n=1 Tax=Chondrus crispus TaxID=2769 RepID=R7QBH7_CHOCR|nr:unnamed protein product [Chondrus crispus]CDF35128.1 unnamed protein product [Chondrus crispus]|eukprot:XP_005714947.1 unnamed protein product [Chondrus crispus]